MRSWQIRAWQMSGLSFPSLAAETQNTESRNPQTQQQSNANFWASGKTFKTILNIKLSGIWFGCSEKLGIYLTLHSIFIHFIFYTSTFRAVCCERSLPELRPDRRELNTSGKQSCGKGEVEWLIQQMGLKWDVVWPNMTKTWVKCVNRTPTFFNCSKCESMFGLVDSSWFSLSLVSLHLLCPHFATPTFTLWHVKQISESFIRLCAPLMFPEQCPHRQAQTIYTPWLQSSPGSVFSSSKYTSESQGRRRRAHFVPQWYSRDLNP